MSEAANDHFWVRRADSIKGVAPFMPLLQLRIKDLQRRRRVSFSTPPHDYWTSPAGNHQRIESWRRDGAGNVQTASLLELP